MGDISAPGVASETRPPALVVRGLTKRFQGVVALHDVDVDFHAGRVHVLFGENGAGKSTLIKILAGVHRADAGRIVLHGRELHDLPPRQAREAGITAVFQEPALVPQLSVAENLGLGREILTMGVVRRGRMRSGAREALERIGSRIPPDTIVGTLSRAEQQIVEVARALQSAADVLILDEPTASLTDSETTRLFQIVRQLRSEGLAVIYITHRMREIRQIGDDVSILRDGAMLRTCRLDEIDDQTMVTTMTGRVVDHLFPTIRTAPGRTALLLEGLSGGAIHDVDLEVRTGEVVGLAGLVGSGKSVIGQLVFGLSHVRSGRITILGRTVDPEATPAQRMRQGIMYYPGDRKRDGLIQVRPVRENVTLPLLGRWLRGGVLDRRRERQDTLDVLTRLALRPMAPEALPSAFSGGNQQKIVLARGFIERFPIHILDEPTAGVDVGARADIYAYIQGLAEEGAAILLISSDLPEVLGLSQRLYVVTEGRVAAELRGDEVTEDRALPYFFAGHHLAGIAASA